MTLVDDHAPLPVSPRFGPRPAPGPRASGPRALDGVGRPGAGRLFELAEAAAALLGGPVEIMDPELRMLAFANLDHPVDALRTESIMGRRTPEPVRRWLAESGALAGALRPGAGAVVEPPGARRRLVASAVAGQAVLGYVSLAESHRTLTERDLPALTDVAATVAGQLAEAGRTPAEPDRDVAAAALLGRVLAGTTPFEVLARRLAPRRSRWYLVALAPGGPAGPNSPAGRDGAAGRDGTGTEHGDGGLARRVRLSCPGATAVRRDGQVLALLPADGEPEALRLAGLLRDRCADWSGAEPVACLSAGFGPADDAAAAGRTLELAVSALAGSALAGSALAGSAPAGSAPAGSAPAGSAPAGSAPAGRATGTGRGRGAERAAVHTVGQLRPWTVLAELSELAQAHPGLAEGTLEPLRSGGSARDGEYLGTLRAYFDAGCDLTEAARSLHLHRNTLRYRLRRIEQLCGVELADPVPRFVLELQVRLHFLAGGDGPSWPGPA